MKRDNLLKWDKRREKRQTYEKRQNPEKRQTSEKTAERLNTGNLFSHRPGLTKRIKARLLN